MDLAGCHFTYAGTSSRLYDLRFINCNTSEYTSINGKTKSMTVFNARGNRNHFISDSYADSPISFDAEVMTDDERPLTVQEIRDIEKWLFNRKGYYKLYIDIADDCAGETYEIVYGEEKMYYFNCRFTNPSKLFGNGGIIGFKFTVECDSMLLWQDTIDRIFETNLSSSSDSTVISLDINTDMDEYVYPKITITMGSEGGNISITNNTDDSTRITSFHSLTGGIEFIINGNLNYISGDNYTKFYDKNFVRLVPGTNNIGIIGNISEIKFEWNNRKYL